MPDFKFVDPGLLVDGELELVLVDAQQADSTRGRVPAYCFEMRVLGKKAGLINLRISDSMKMVNHCGQIGYAVEPEFRGRHFAERACRLILPIAKAHGQNPVYITCHPDNAASRRTIERLGAEYIGTVVVPLHSDMYDSGSRVVRRYRLEV